MKIFNSISIVERLGDMPDISWAIERQNKRRKEEKDLLFHHIPSSSTTAGKT